MKSGIEGDERCSKLKRGDSKTERIKVQKTKRRRREEREEREEKRRKRRKGREKSLARR